MSGSAKFCLTLQPDLNSPRLIGRSIQRAHSQSGNLEDSSQSGLRISGLLPDHAPTSPDRAVLAATGESGAQKRLSAIRLTDLGILTVPCRWVCTEISNRWYRSAGSPADKRWRRVQLGLRRQRPSCPRRCESSLRPGDEGSRRVAAGRRTLQLGVECQLVELSPLSDDQLADLHMVDAHHRDGPGPSVHRGGAPQPVAHGHPRAAGASSSQYSSSILSDRSGSRSRRRATSERTPS